MDGSAGSRTAYFFEPFSDSAGYSGLLQHTEAEMRSWIGSAVCVSPDPLNPLNDVSTMNKVLEYMACGRPIVAYDLREHRCSAAEGALYATPNLEQDLAAKIQELLEDPERRRCMGAYNRRRFLEVMAWEHNAGELLRAYEMLCGPKPNA